MQYHFGWAHGDAPFAGATMYCVPIVVACLNGPFSCPCFCGRSAAANAARGIWVFSSAGGG